ncbi:MAG: hypothetical protein R6V74_05015, partial [Lutibacter sp.]
LSHDVFAFFLPSYRRHLLEQADWRAVLDRLDRLLTHRIFGPVFLAAAMLGLYQFTPFLLDLNSVIPLVF